MVDLNNTGKLLSFPAPAPMPRSSAEDWSNRVLETRDNLVSALEFLRFAYNEKLAGKPVRAVDQILAQVDAILRQYEKTPPYTVVAAIRIKKTKSPLVKRKDLLLFPDCKQCLRKPVTGRP